MLIVRKFIWVLLFSVFLGILLACLVGIQSPSPNLQPSPGTPSPEATPPPASPLPHILLDPGHGGWDGGTHDHNGLKEKDIALRFGFLLKNELEHYGFPVSMTRTTDRELSEFAPYQGTRQRTDLCARARMITKYDADLFVSLHVNAASNTNLCGAITFYQRKSAESKLFAQYIQNAIQTVQPYNRQTILPGNFYLLNASPVPATLLEIAFITHPTEHTLLQDSVFLQKMACEVARGIYQYATEANKATTSFELWFYILPRLRA